jgi:hypothetical protein
MNCTYAYFKGTESLDLVLGLKETLMGSLLSYGYEYVRKMMSIQFSHKVLGSIMNVSKGIFSKYKMVGKYNNSF